MIFCAMPLVVEIQKNKTTIEKKTINLNYYRNWHRFTENKVKESYQNIVISLLFYLKKKKLDFIEIDFVFYKKSRSQKDKANFLSIHEKYFCDALTKLEIIEDDNDDFIGNTRYFNGGIDRNDPRVEIFIYY